MEGEKQRYVYRDALRSRKIVGEEEKDLAALFNSKALEGEKNRESKDFFGVGRILSRIFEENKEDI